MTLVELDSEAVEILSKIVKREKYANAGDAIRHLNNLSILQGAVINKLEKEIDRLKMHH